MTRNIVLLRHVRAPNSQGPTCKAFLYYLNEIQELPSICEQTTFHFSSN
jgi:hypothetical protein